MCIRDSGYKAPTLKTAAEPWEPYALAVLDGILDGGNSGRISRNLVRGSQVAAAAGTCQGTVSETQRDVYKRQVKCRCKRFKVSRSLC